MVSPRIGSKRSFGSYALSAFNRVANALGLALSRHPAPTTKEWHLATLLDYRDVNVVLDVGANDGQFATSLRRLGFRGWIVSFEPVPATYERLRAAFERDPKWRGFPWALGDRNVERPFHVTRGDAQASSFLELNDRGAKRWGDDHTVAETVPVAMKRLDSVWTECVDGIDAPRALLKMDCQGFDLQVVDGAEGVQQHIVGLMSELAFEHYYEGMTDFSTAVSRYEALGFDPVGFFPQGRRTPDFLRAVEMDCIFMRRP